jgi:hypothetical protein
MTMDNVPFKARWAVEDRAVAQAVDRVAASLERAAEDQRFLVDMLCDKCEADGTRRALQAMLEESPLARTALIVTYRDEIAAYRRDDAERQAEEADELGSDTA